MCIRDRLTLLRWLDPAKQPMLLQVPEAQLATVRATWSLPAELQPATH